MSEVAKEGDKVFVKKHGKMFEVRKLNKREREIYANTVQLAIVDLPSFSDAVALLRPFYDGSAPTLYTDRYARVGIGDAFFNTFTTAQRKATIIHESMHVMNNHFAREDMMGLNDPKLGNIAGDFEINCVIDTIKTFDISIGILPNKHPYSYPPNLNLENYIKLMMEDPEFQLPIPGNACPVHSEDNPTENDDQDPTEEQGKTDTDNSGCGAKEKEEKDSTDEEGSSNSSSGSDQDGSNDSNGNNSGSNDSHPSSSNEQCTCGREPSPCDTADDENVSAADAAGIERASDAEQNIAKKITAARIVEKLKKNKTRGGGHDDALLKLTMQFLKPAKVPWQAILRSTFSRLNDSIARGRSDYSYRRSNRRMNDSDFVFPGLVKYIPKTMFAIDTSGSMDQTDYISLLTEAESILKESKKGKDSFKVFSIDTVVGNVKPVKSVKEIKLVGGGGTDMSVGLKYANELPKKQKPDLFVLATDGYTDWMSYQYEVDKIKDFFHVLLITTKGGYKSVPDKLKRNKKMKVVFIGSDES